MMYSKNKEINDLVQKLVALGWQFRRPGKHGRLSHPSGRATLTVPISPSDRRSHLNFRCDLRKALQRIFGPAYPLQAEFAAI